MTPKLFKQADRRIQAMHAASGAASLALAVAKDGTILFETGYGWADRQARKPASADTLYSLASISKPITATALMVLVDRHAVELDRPFNTYLGPAKLTAHVGDADTATVRRVACHSAGLPTHVHVFYADEGRQPPPVDETIRRYGHLRAPPGEVYHYANSGYGFISYVIERLSGHAFAEFLRDEVFVPLGMPRASLDIPSELAPYAAVRYAPDGHVLPWYTFDHPGASAVWASAHDLVRFGAFHLSGRLPGQRAILSAAALRAMQRPAVHTGNRCGYGIGWRIADDDGGYRTVGHDGAMSGVRTRLLLVPEACLAVAVLANGDGALPIDVATELIDVLLPGYAANRRKQQSAPVPAPGAWPAADLLGHWTGAIQTYAGDHALELVCQPDGTAIVRLDRQIKPVLGRPRYADGRWNLDVDGTLGVEEAERYPCVLRLALKRRGHALHGPIYVISRPPDRLGNVLGFWTALSRIG